MSLSALPASKFDSELTLASEFYRHGCHNFRRAAEYVRDLPYGRNKGSPAHLCVLADGRGTCSSKHALVTALAREQGLDVRLILGIYEMDNENTPGVGSILSAAYVPAIPEAHCWIEYDGVPADLTSGDAQSQFEKRVFIHKEEIEPDQTGAYKEKAHRDFLSCWLGSQPQIKLNEKELWDVRERCIAALFD